MPNSSMLESARKITHFSFKYEKADKTDSLQPSGYSGPLVFTNTHNEKYHLIPKKFI